VTRLKLRKRTVRTLPKPHAKLLPRVRRRRLPGHDPAQATTRGHSPDVTPMPHCGVFLPVAFREEDQS